MMLSCSLGTPFTLRAIRNWNAGTPSIANIAAQRTAASSRAWSASLHHARCPPVHVAGEVGPNKPKRGPKPPAPGAAQQQEPAKDEAFLLDDEDEDGDSDQYLAPVMDAVVKVYCVHTEPNYSLPWQRKRQYSSTSSGFIAGDGKERWLLTNAHSVDHHTQVKVKRRGDDRKFLARVLAIGIDCDIALLTVDDAEFWEGVEPLQFGTLPRLQDSVAVIGYPVGGDTISVTAGVVSRIEVTDYTHGSTDLLAIQIDAAINGGNSGGPVFNRHRQCVGIAFQALTGDDVENVGYVIPTPVVQHFLADYRLTGQFNGFPALGIGWQRMESDALRRAFKMGPGQKGILVRMLNPTSDAAQLLKTDDVITKFNGVEISSDGTVPFRTGERIAFSYLISNMFVGDECDLEVWRDGQALKLHVKLSKPNSLVPPHIRNDDPSYFIVSGLVFTAVSEPYLMSEYGPEYGSDSPVRLLDRLYHGFPKSPDEQVVVLSQVLASDATLGYEDITNIQVLRFNGTTINNLKQLAELVIGCDTKYMRFDLEYGEVVVIETVSSRVATPHVMAAHSVPHSMSSDLRAVLPPWPHSTAKA